MTFWQFIKQVPPQLVFVLLAFALPTAARILKKLGEQAQKREAGIKRERDELERLRTGRAETAEPSAAPSARATLEEMAAKRRAQIEELRQRRQAQMNAPQTQRSAPVQAQVPVERPRSAAAQVPRPAPAARAAPAMRSAPVMRPAPGRNPASTPNAAPVPRPAARTPELTTDQRDRVRARQQGQAREQAELDRRQREKDKTDQERQRRVKAQQRDRAPRIARQDALAAVAATATPESVAAAKQDAAAIIAVARPDRRKIVFAKGDLRRAFIMQELLLPPLSERQVG